MERALSILGPIAESFAPRKQESIEERFLNKQYESPPKSAIDRLEKMASARMQPIPPPPPHPHMQQHPMGFQSPPPQQWPQPQPLQTPPPPPPPQQDWGFYDQAAYAYDQSLNELRKSVEALRTSSAQHESMMEKRMAAFVELHDKVMREMLLILKNGTAEVKTAVEQVHALLHSQQQQQQQQPPFHGDAHPSSSSTQAELFHMDFFSQAAPQSQQSPCDLLTSASSPTIRDSSIAMVAAASPTSAATEGVLRVRKIPLDDD